jgi:hypothetical protein
VKAASILAIALVLIATAVPAAAACCGAQSNKTMAMHASMACCGNHCKIVAPSVTPDANGVLAPGPANPLPAAVVTGASTTISTVVASIEVNLDSNLFASPPSFLSQHQFRI